MTGTRSHCRTRRRVAARDADLPPHDQHAFTLQDVSSELRDVFAIDRLTGVIYTRRVLDRETTDSYQLTALVTGSHAITTALCLSCRRSHSGTRAPS